ncbi:MAG: hypothetical protein WAN51_09715 [Alphaproteobacteria bacterium]
MTANRHKQKGDYGERIVAAKLAHPNRGWIVNDLNKGIRNQPRFDLLAVKDEGEPVFIRVKTCYSEVPERAQPVFGIDKGEPNFADVVARDFTIFVIMGQDESSDRFYVVPTKEVRQTMIERWRDYYSRPHSKHGGRKIDNGQLTLFFHPHHKCGLRPGYDLARKWSEYRDAWHLLEEEPPPRWINLPDPGRGMATQD